MPDAFDFADGPDYQPGSSSDDDTAPLDDRGETGTSPLIQWLRRVYDAIFFYGLEPAPAVQRRNKRKIMQQQDGESDRDAKKSVFFTPTEQRVQQYMSTRRPDAQTSSSRSSGGGGSGARALRRRLKDLSEELELVEAELLTTPEGTAEHALLGARREQFLALMGDLEDRLVAAGPASGSGS